MTRNRTGSPLVTFSHGAGDCEDYAIAKFVALRQAGIAPLLPAGISRELSADEPDQDGEDQEDDQELEGAVNPGKAEAATAAAEHRSAIHRGFSHLSGGADDDQVNLVCGDARIFNRRLRGLRGEIAGEFPIGGDVALADVGALTTLAAL